MKKVKVISEIPDAMEKELILYFRDGKLNLKQMSIEALWGYVMRAYRTGEDPDDIMHIPQNSYSIGRAEKFGMARERKAKYGR